MRFKAAKQAVKHTFTFKEDRQPQSIYTEMQSNYLWSSYRKHKKYKLMRPTQRCKAFKKRRKEKLKSKQINEKQDAT